MPAVSNCFGGAVVTVHRRARGERREYQSCIEIIQVQIHLGDLCAPSGRQLLAVSLSIARHISQEFNDFSNKRKPRRTAVAFPVVDSCPIHSKLSCHVLLEKIQIKSLLYQVITYGIQ